MVSILLTQALEVQQEPELSNHRRKELGAGTSKVGNQESERLVSAFSWLKELRS